MEIYFVHLETKLNVEDDLYIEIPYVRSIMSGCGDYHVNV